MAVIFSMIIPPFPQENKPDLSKKVSNARCRGITQIFPHEVDGGEDFDRSVEKFEVRISGTDWLLVMDEKDSDKQTIQFKKQLDVRLLAMSSVLFPHRLKDKASKHYSTSKSEPRSLFSYLLPNG